MAVPKGKVSKQRRNSRRANWKLSAPSLVECPRCHQMRLTHHVCKKCGYYDGREVMKVAAEK